MTLRDALFCRLPSSWAVDPSACLYEWQTLIGGMLALIAVIASIFLIQRQIRLTSFQHNDIMGRRFQAALSLLPLALNETQKFSEETAEYAKKIAGSTFVGIPRFPDLDFIPRVYPLFKDAIEASDDKALSAVLREIISHSQFIVSRVKFRAEIQHFSKESLSNLLVRCAIVNFLSWHLIPVARGQTNTNLGALDWEGVEHALLRMGFYPTEWKRAFRLLHRCQRSRIPLLFVDQKLQ